MSWISIPGRPGRGRCQPYGDPETVVAEEPLLLLLPLVSEPPLLSLLPVLAEVPLPLLLDGGGGVDDDVDGLDDELDGLEDVLEPLPQTAKMLAGLTKLLKPCSVPELHMRQDQHELFRLFGICYRSCMLT